MLSRLMALFERTGVGVMAVNPGIDLPAPTPGNRFLQVRDGNGLHLLVGDFQHPTAQDSSRWPAPGP